MANHVFVLSDQDGELYLGHMIFQEKKIICSPGMHVGVH